MAQATLSAFIGAVLLIAGAGKVGDPDGFARTVLSHQVLPWSASRVVGRWLPVVELVLGAALVVGLATPATGAVAAALFGAFTASLLGNRLRGRTELSCGCFGGSAPSRLTWFVVARPAVLGAGALLVASGALTPETGLGAAERLVAIAAGVVPVLGVRGLLAVRDLSTAPPAPSPTASAPLARR